MKKQKNVMQVYLQKGFMSIVMIALIIIMKAVSADAADVTYTFSEDKSGNTYAYDYFGKQPNGKKLQEFYRNIDKVIKSIHSNEKVNIAADCVIHSFNYADLGLTSDEAIKVALMYKLDNPMYYWISKTVDYSGTELTLKVNPTYAKGAVRVKENKVLASKIQYYLNCVKGETNPYAIAAILQREIGLKAEYKRDKYNNPSEDENCHNIVGILEEKGTVCEGYAKLFSLLLNEVGVENVIVTGISADQAHAWNMVKASDGKWYYCDLTWDDNSMMLYDTNSFYYFMKGSDKFENHEAYTESGLGAEFLYALPTASTTDHPDNKKFGKSFKIGKNTYTVVGYNEVSFLQSKLTGKVVIPETVTKNGVTYTVVALGKDEFFDTFLWQRVTSVTIPKTVRMIWDYALGAYDLKSIIVNKNNKYYRSLNGVLYTKNYFELVQYPSSKKTKKLTLPGNVHYIHSHAIDTKGELYIGELVVNKKLEEVGVMNWGTGPLLKNVSLINVIQGSWGGISRCCKKITISKSNKNFYVKNNLVMRKGGIYYDNNYEKYVAGEVVIAVAKGDAKSVTLPTGTVAIDRNAFYRLPNLTTIKFNKKIKVIAESAIESFKGSKIILPSTVTWIGAYWLTNCFNEKTGKLDIYVPKSVKHIDSDISVSTMMKITIHGVRGSYAQKYAKKYGYKFSTKAI